MVRVGKGPGDEMKEKNIRPKSRMDVRRIVSSSVGHQEIYRSADRAETGTINRLQHVKHAQHTLDAA